MSDEKWHAINIDEVARIMRVDLERGLSEKDAKERLAKYGYNELPVKVKKNLLGIILDQIKDIFVMLLIFAAFIAMFVEKNIIDAIVILAIIIINVIIGTYQEYKAENVMEKLRKYTSPKAKVIRNGVVKEIPAREIVPGDIILLEEGDKVPADARLIEVANLKVDESALTGESTPVSKATRTLAENTITPDQINMAFMGTYVVSGRAKGIVVRTGLKTEFGRIAKLVEEIREEPTPLKMKLSAFAKKMALAVAVITVILIIVGYIKYGTPHLIESVMVALSLAVAAVPEGLPVILTITLAFAAKILAKNNALVKYLLAAETLGSVTVIASDKTGTITKGEMTIKKIYVPTKEYSVTGVGYEPKGKFFLGDKEADPRSDKRLELLLKAGALCTNVGIAESYVGDPTEIAIVVAAQKAGLDKRILEHRYPRIAEIPFSSERKMMTTIHLVDGKKVAYVKGAPELVLIKSKYILSEDGVVRLDENMYLEIERKIEQYASEGYRVLGIAYRELPEDVEISEEEVERNLIFIGLVAMLDPPREEVYEAIEKTKRAGIKVIMITGDHALTAKAIAEKIGLYQKGDKVITGKELDEMSDEELDNIIEEVRVFARVMPEHKLRIVKALKKRGHIVAMTGDGVNDAPALKEAHIGVAMGIKGTDVAREAADLILLDDNFATIVRAVEIGRGVYDRIRSFTRYLMSCNIAEILIIALGVLFFTDVPLLPAMILWINLVTDGPPATALAWDPEFEDVMSRPPRDPKEGLFSDTLIFMLVASIVLTAGVMATYFIMYMEGYSLEVIRTVVFLQIALYELTIVWNTRSEEYSVFKIGLKGNKWLVIAVLFSVLATIAIVYVPLFSLAFHTVPIGLKEWLYVVAVSMLGLFIVPEVFIKPFKK